jgi:hypothetical protein
MITMLDLERVRDTASTGRLQDDTPPEADAGGELEVERGPNWLFVRVTGKDIESSAGLSLAERLELLLSEYFTTRIVLEFDVCDVPQSQLIGQLEHLDQWVEARDGLIRLCGLPPKCVRALTRRGLGARLRNCHNREEAVLCSYLPGRPR